MTVLDRITLEEVALTYLKTLLRVGSEDSMAGACVDNDD